MCALSFWERALSQLICMARKNLSTMHEKASNTGWEVVKSSVIHMYFHCRAKVKKSLCICKNKCNDLILQRCCSIFTLHIAFALNTSMNFNSWQERVKQDIINKQFSKNLHLSSQRVIKKRASSDRKTCVHITIAHHREAFMRQRVRWLSWKRFSVGSSANT